MSKKSGKSGAIIVGGILAGLALLGLGFGLGTGVGDGDGDGADDKVQGTKVIVEDSQGDSFVILVEEDKIVVNGQTISANEAAALGKKDGRPVRIIWKKAKTGAESQLKQALQEANISGYDEVSVD